MRNLNNNIRDMKENLMAEIQNSILQNNNNSRESNDLLNNIRNGMQQLIDENRQDYNALYNQNDTNHNDKKQFINEQREQLQNYVSDELNNYKTERTNQLRINNQNTTEDMTELNNSIKEIKELLISEIGKYSLSLAEATLIDDEIEVKHFYKEDNFEENEREAHRAELKLKQFLNDKNDADISKKETIYPNEADSSKKETSFSEYPEDSGTFESENPALKKSNLKIGARQFKIDKINEIMGSEEGLKGLINEIQKLNDPELQYIIAGDESCFF
jgi:hypothetical protein